MVATVGSKITADRQEVVHHGNNLPLLPQVDNRTMDMATLGMIKVNRLVLHLAFLKCSKITELHRRHHLVALLLHRHPTTHPHR